MLIIPYLQKCIMTNATMSIRVSKKTHKKYKRIAVDDEITIGEALERDLQ